MPSGNQAISWANIDQSLCCHIASLGLNQLHMFWNPKQGSLSQMINMIKTMFNSLWPGRFWWNFRWVLFKPITVVDGWDTCYEIALRKMSQDLTDDKSTLVQVMAWCRQATSHYLNQCWPSFMSPYGVTRPQWVNPQWWPISATLPLHYPPT